MYSMARVFPITGFGPDGKPTIAAAFPLLASGSAETEVNNISCTITPESVTRTWKADNREERDEIKTGYKGTLTFYGIDAEALSVLTPNYKDSKGHTVLTSSAGGAPKVVLFYRGKDDKGKKYNAWLYNVEFEDPAISAAQEEETPKSVSINFFAGAVIWHGKLVFGLIVWEGSEGYLAEGEEPTSAAMPMPEAA